MISIGDSSILNMMLGDIEVKKIIFQDTVVYENTSSESESTTE